MSEVVKYRGVAKLVLTVSRCTVHQRDELFVKYLKAECPTFEPDFDGEDYYWGELFYEGFIIIDNNLYKLDNKVLDLEEGYTNITEKDTGDIEYETVFYNGVDTLSSVIEEGLKGLVEKESNDEN